MKTIEEAINIMEPGARVTDEQIARLDSDAGLREACRDVMAMQAQLAGSSFDAAKALARFHAGHREARVRPLRRYVAAALAAAAVVVGAVFLLRPAATGTATVTEPPVFTAEADVQQITIAKGKAAPVPLAVTRTKSQADPVARVESTATATVEQQTVAIPFGESLQLILSDGTQAYMHPCSRLIYPTTFAGGKREVWLEGEAYFCVAHDATRQFVVHTPHADVRDYGTEFNIKTGYTQTEVVLVEGSAGVTPRKTTGETMLCPGQRATCTLAGDEQQLTLSETETDVYTAWRDGYFYFDQVSLRDILRQLGQYYNLSVEVYQEPLLDLHLRYIIPRASSADFAILKLGELVKGRVRLSAGRIVVG